MPWRPIIARAHITEKEIVMFNQVDTAAANLAIESLAQGEKTSKAIINEWAPALAAGTHAGDNIVVTNRLIQACAGHRAKEVAIFLRTVVPYDYDKETLLFTTKHKDAKKVEAKATNLAAFIKSGVTVFGWLAGNVKVQKKDSDPVELYKKRLMLELFFQNVDGLSAEDVATIFGKVAGMNAEK
jgi:hypothetical protein